jgi:hypothetical protein
MKYKSTLQVILIGCIALPFTLRSHSASAPESIPHKVAHSEVAVDEVLSYECARSITSLIPIDEQWGPVFSHGNLVFTSVEAQDFSKLLIVNAGAGNYVIKLEGLGVNRIRFEVPSGRGQARVFFMSYMHGNRMRSRYFDFSEGKAPVGRDELDYALVPARRADHLLAHLDYAIHETAAATLNAIVDGRLDRAQLEHHRIENCEHIARLWPNLGNDLKRKIDQIDLFVMGPNFTHTSSRLPASVLGTR